MPMIREEYHPDWPEISEFVRFVRAQNKCEKCNVKNGAVIRRLEGDQYVYATGCELLRVAFVTTCYRLSGKLFTHWEALEYCGFTKVILTTAHLDRNRENNELYNLQALCQRCHLLHDHPQHVRNRAYGRYHDRSHQLQLFSEPGQADPSPKK